MPVDVEEVGVQVDLEGVGQRLQDLERRADEADARASAAERRAAAAEEALARLEERIDKLHLTVPRKLVEAGRTAAEAHAESMEVKGVVLQQATQLLQAHDEAVGFRNLVAEGLEDVGRQVADLRGRVVDTAEGFQRLSERVGRVSRRGRSLVQEVRGVSADRVRLQS